MKLFIYLTALLCAIPCLGQTYYPDCRDVGSKIAVDTCKIRITYDFCFVYNRAYYDRNLLEIGHHTNRFYSLYSDMRDSMEYNHYSSITPTDIIRLEQGINSTNWLNPNRTALYADIYTFLGHNERLVSTRFEDAEYRYIEKCEPFDWNIIPAVSDAVLGYECYKAETTFRGRKWIVWFSPELPYSFGPWKFMGLPGLILKVASDDGQFLWTAIGITTPSSCPIYDYADKALYNLNRSSEVIPSHKKITCKRKDVDKLWKIQWLAPLSLIFMDGEEHIIFDMSTNQKVKFDPNNIPDGYYPKLELDL